MKHSNHLKKGDSRLLHECFYFHIGAIEALECFNSVLMVFEVFPECLKGVGCFISVSSVFEGCFNCVLRVFQECFKSVSRVFKGCLKIVSRLFQE